MGAQHWTTTEVSVLQKHYPVGGLPACQPLLPERTGQSIFWKARTLGLSAPNAAPNAGRKRYHSTEQIDEAIRAFYAKPVKAGQMPIFSERIKRPYWWIKNRAAELGVAVPRVKPLPWSSEEIAILKDSGHLTPRRIAIKLKAAGFKRSTTAVVMQLKRVDGIDRTDPDTFTFNELARLMGVDDKTVRRWHEKEGMPAKRKHQDVSGGTWMVTRRQLRSWMASHQQLIDLRKVDRFWFLDLVFAS